MPIFSNKCMQKNLLHLFDIEIHLNVRCGEATDYIEGIDNLTL